MRIREVNLEEAHGYLSRFEKVRDEIDYGCNEFRRHLESYCQSPNPQTSIDLKSSIALFEKHIDPFFSERRVVGRRYSDDRGAIKTPRF